MFEVEDFQLPLTIFGQLFFFRWKLLWVKETKSLQLRHIWEAITQPIQHSLNVFWLYIGFKILFHCIHCSNDTPGPQLSKVDIWLRLNWKNLTLDGLIASTVAFRHGCTSVKSTFCFWRLMTVVQGEGKHRPEGKHKQWTYMTWQSSVAHVPLAHLSQKPLCLD